MKLRVEVSGYTYQIVCDKVSRELRTLLETEAEAKDERQFIVLDSFRDYEIAELRDLTAKYNVSPDDIKVDWFDYRGIFEVQGFVFKSDFFTSGKYINVFLDEKPIEFDPKEITVLKLKSIPEPQHDKPIMLTYELGQATYNYIFEVENFEPSQITPESLQFTWLDCPPLITNILYDHRNNISLDCTYGDVKEQGLFFLD